MSLINDMLKNLERRQHQATNPFGKTPYPPHAHSEKRDLWRALIAAGIIAAISGGSYLAYKKWHLRHHPTFTANANLNTPLAQSLPTIAASNSPANALVLAKPTTEPSAATTNPAPPVVGQNLPPPPKVLSDIRIENTGNQTNLFLDLNQATSYRIEPVATDVVSVLLKDTFLERQQICAAFGNPPNCMIGTRLPIPISASLVQSIDVMNNDGRELKLSFSLKPGTKIINQAIVTAPKTALQLTFGDTSHPSTPIAMPVAVENKPTSVPVSIVNGAIVSAAPSSPMPPSTGGISSPNFPTPSAPTPGFTAPVNNQSTMAMPASTITPSDANNSQMNTLLASGPTDNMPTTSDENQMLKPSKKTPLSDNDNIYTHIITQINLGRYAEAEKNIQDLPPDPDNPAAAAMLRARILVAQNNYNEAAKLLESYRHLKHLPGDYYAFLAALYEFTKQHDKAVTLYQDLVNFWPTNPDWWLGLGVSAMHAGNIATAKDAFHHVLSIGTIDPEVENYVRSQLARLAIES